MQIMPSFQSKRGMTGTAFDKMLTAELSVAVLVCTEYK